jgi:endoglucanase
MIRTARIAILAVLALGLAAPSASAGPANGGLPGATANPIEGVTWGTYRTDSTDPSLDPPSAYFNTARNARDRTDLAKLLAVPRFRWFGAWVPTLNQGNKWGARKTAAKYIEAVQQGDRNVAVGIGVFRLQPFEREACRRLPTGAEVADYKRWIQEFAGGISDSRVILLLQPDMPFTLCLPRNSQTHLKLINWTVKQFSALPHTTVYIDAGASDWLHPSQAASMLKRAGVAHARGFGLNLTHYDSTARSVAYGKQIVRLLARRGVKGVHFTVSTAMNGRPFISYKHRRTFKLGTECKSRSDRACVTLGQKPTTQTSTPLCDGYLWFGRPWIDNAFRRSYDEVLQIIRTSPYF